ncbi:MAG: TauD/TfdA family dioxygenase [Cognatishimia sp.]
MQLTLDMGAERLDIRWPDGTNGQFPYIWLRDTDPAGFHPLTGERSFDLTSVALDVAPSSAEVEGEALLVQWPDQAQPSRFDLHWLKAHRPGIRRPDAADLAPTLWRAEAGAEGVPRVSAAAMDKSEDVFASWLRVTKQYGISIVEGLADAPTAGKEIARRIGHLRETNFGVEFEVKTKPDPNNLAYTAEALPLHTDLPNQEVPPGFQFLHCLANEAQGGGSTFCDGRAVAEDLRTLDPDAFAILSTVSIPFRFQDSDADIRSRKTMIVLDEAGAVSEVCFNAHIADVLDLPADDMLAFYRAYRRFMALTRGADYTISLKLQAGEMVVFNNRAVLHGREAFDPQTGRRHLHGCYVDRGEWDSRIRLLARG